MGGGRTSGSFNDGKRDGNAVNEEGWDKKLCIPRRDRRAGEDPEAAEEAAADQVWAEIEFDCKAAGDGIDNEPLSSSSPLLPSPGETVAALW